jgi:hypothetical protein
MSFLYPVKRHTLSTAQVGVENNPFILLELSAFANSTDYHASAIRHNKCPANSLYVTVRLARLANETSYNPEVVRRIFESIRSQCQSVERIAPLFSIHELTLYIFCLLLFQKMLIF